MREHAIFRQSKTVFQVFGASGETYADCSPLPKPRRDRLAAVRDRYGTVSAESSFNVMAMPDNVGGWRGASTLAFAEVTSAVLVRISNTTTGERKLWSHLEH